MTEKKDAGIHEDAFFVGRTMFMHIHGHTHCEIFWPKPARNECWPKPKRENRLGRNAESFEPLGIAA